MGSASNGWHCKVSLQLVACFILVWCCLFLDNVSCIALVKHCSETSVNSGLKGILTTLHVASAHAILLIQFCTCVSIPKFYYHHKSTTFQCIRCSCNLHHLVTNFLVVAQSFLRDVLNIMNDLWQLAHGYTFTTTQLRWTQMRKLTQGLIAWWPYCRSLSLKTW